MEYTLFIDPQLSPPDKFADSIICRDLGAAYQIVERFGCPSKVSIQHDMGSNFTGLDFANWLIHKDIENKGSYFPEGFQYEAHSFNQIGNEKIISTFKQYFEHRTELNAPGASETPQTYLPLPRPDLAPPEPVRELPKPVWKEDDEPLKAIEPEIDEEYFQYRTYKETRKKGKRR